MGCGMKSTSLSKSCSGPFRQVLALPLFLLVLMAAPLFAQTVPLTITVNTLAGDNDGICGPNGADPLQDCSLLEAIELANSTPEAAVIEFSVSGVILLSDGVVIKTPVTLDGTTAPGGAHSVRIDGSETSNNLIVVTGADASGSEVRGLVVGQAPGSGIVIDSDAENVRVVGNFIGTNAAGNKLGNGLDGVVIRGGSKNNSIGGVAPGEGNTIGFNNASGVFIGDAETTGNRVLGNFIGTNVAGASMGNVRQGVAVGFGASENTIGGAEPGEGNTIGFNGLSGVLFFSENTIGNALVGNFIGTNAAGNNRGNVGSGVAILAGASDNLLGGAAPGEGNTIGFNKASGVFIGDAETTGNHVLGNFIGTNAAGKNLGNARNGVAILTGASDNMVGGAASGAGNIIGFNLFGVTIEDEGTTGNAVLGNFIGSNAAGDKSLGNGFHGVVVRGGASNNVIGGAGAGNTIGYSGYDGVSIQGVGTTGNALLGNTIGTSADGQNLGNGRFGVVVTDGASSNAIGGAGAGNTIGFNDLDGVFIQGAGTTGNALEGNFIGTNSAGQNLRNTRNGVTAAAGVSGNTIGGVAPGAGNTIGLNNGAGVIVSGPSTQGNAILRNSIFDNEGLGIDLSAESAFGDGVTANDGCGDPDTGPNSLQNFPVLLSAFVGGGATTIDFDLDTAAGDYRVEFFSVLAAHPLGHGEGRTFLGAEQVSVSETCDDTFQAVLALDVSTDVLITATATPLDGTQTSGFGGTSEFSAAVITAATPIQIAINAGDGQSTTVGTEVPIAPSVLVTDVYDNPVEKLEVTFAVALGGGSVTGAVAMTDASGIATVGSWTLGATAGENTLTAGAAGLTQVTFTATGTTVPAAPTDVSATAGNTKATVTWAAPTDDGGSAITGYTVTGDPGGSCSVAGGVTECTITGLTNGTEYIFTVVATNAHGPGAVSEPSNTIVPSALLFQDRFESTLN